MNDGYFIAFDEYDEPYIAHDSDSGWKKHKYLMKIPNALGDGKALYLYTQKEIDAWQNGKRRTLSNRIRDILGYDERDAAIDAHNVRKNANDALLYQNKKFNNRTRLSDKEASLYRRTQDRVAKADEQLYKAEKAYGRTAVGIFDKVKNFFGNAISKITGRSRKAEEVIEENADVKLSDIKEDSSAFYQAQKDRQTAAERKAEEARKIDSSAHYAAEKDQKETTKRSAQNQNGSTEKEDASDIKNMRKVAMQVLRGDLGNGQERVKKLTSMGYDPRTIQVIAGNLMWTPGMSDKALQDILKMI